MSRALLLKKLAWVAAVQLAITQPGYSQDETPVDADVGTESPAQTMPAETPLAEAAAEEVIAEPAPVAEADVVAEAPAADPEARATTSRVFEEIIVTAQKRDENLSDVPITVQAFSAEALDARGITSTMDLMKATPALDFGVQAGDFASVFLRGIGSEAWLTSDPSVASYVDGVYYSFTPSLIQDLGGVERVEVLKGPQGTLFGRNAIAGAISVITKEPDFEDRSVTIDTTLSSYDSRSDDVSLSKTTIFANVPLTETLAMNVSSFFEYDRQQWTEESTVGGVPVPAKKTFSARVKMRWTPAEKFELRGTVLGSKREGTATLAANINPTPLGQALGISGEDERNREVNPGLPIFGHLQSLVASLTPIYYGDYFDAKLIASKQLHSNPYNYDYDGAEVAFASFIVHKHYAKIDEAELNITSNEGSWGSDWLTWSTGGFYFRNTQGFDPVEVTVAGLNPESLDGLAASGVDLRPVIQNLDELLVGSALELGQTVDTVLGNIGGNGNFPSYALSNIGLLRTESWSTYLQATAQITDWFALTLGGRYQNERRGVLESNTSLRVGQNQEIVFDWQNARDARAPLFGVTSEALPLTDVTKGFTPKVTFDFRPFDNDTLFFLTWQKAVKAHSYNAFAFYLRPAYVPEETIEAYEIGAKGSLFDGTVRYSTGIFHYEIENLQTQFISLLNGGALSLDVAGDARSIGWDFDITAIVLPSMFDSLTFALNGAFIDATYTKYENGDGQDPTTGIFQDNTQTYTGNRITRTPKFSGSAALTNTWLIPGGPLEASANVYHNSGFFYVASEDPRYEQSAYTTLGVRASYLWERHDLRTTLFVDNATDEFYTTGTLILDPGMLATLGMPRTIGLKLQYTF